jgi:hypothetical protein
MIKVPVEELGGVFRLVYRSHVVVAPEHRPAALGAIFDVARARNALLDVTGALMAWQDVVVQVLEGTEAAVRPLYDRIRVDGRHTDVTLLDADTAPGRVFGHWSMAQVGEDDRADIPVFMDPDAGTGVSATPAPDDPRRAVMLDLMREYARADVGPV